MEWLMEMGRKEKAFRLEVVREIFLQFSERSC
jgi:hypothetical protein